MSEAYLHQSLSQQQTLAPQMRKSLEILQAGTLELSQLVRQALEVNPVLEDITESVSLDEELPDPEEADSMDYLNETDDDWRERLIMDGKSSPWTSEDEERRQRLYDSIVAPETLQQHLQYQLDMAMVDPEIRDASQAIIGNLDERGFLDMSAQDLCIRLGIPPKHMDEALKLVQSFDPPGVGASGIPESLLLQLERTGGQESIEYKIVRDHLEDLARKRYPQIARALGTSVERITEAASRIGRLTPNPGGDFDPTGNPYILPDVIIEKNDEGQWSARLTGEHLPNLRINDFYKDLIGRNGTDTKARQFLRDQIRDGRSLIRSISLRQETILAIAHQLIKHQPLFFSRGPRYLRPLTMNDIADELSLHATTVSRAVAGKYVLTPHGLMEMRAFFATGYHTSNGEEVSNAGVREAIQQLVAHENPAKPLSDDALAKKLAQQGIKVARRTVAKYREQLNILPSHLRKSF
ncbi:RNA polymerase factor sigma-54 [Luteolibacter pohnpeiensis]|uniref:RNA polymerase factor sigma-54 n=1 Tax=Luteolibacter pohnpeiensis TaxID=454153 RepID=A0A934S3I8_9BACT|nr:RNA polymerase factor sigma-54 [Luteolibacter pohnpeiensis]MBK1881657.1 RNA polymerase factor sigma-54 [Luteolibacter pohnpeiensis]